MKLNDFLDKLRETDGVVRSTLLHPRRATVEVQPESLIRVAEILYNQEKWRFIIASGMDCQEGFEVLYHFSYDPEGYVVNVKIRLPHDKPEVESLTVLFEAADWIECEMHEILGIRFLHHRALKPLLSGGNWETGEYPYRRKPMETEKVKL
jgi:NADH:ubiquinone oxidoreductase subunit C